MAYYEIKQTSNNIHTCVHASNLSKKKKIDKHGE